MGRGVLGIQFDRITNSEYTSIIRNVLDVSHDSFGDRTFVCFPLLFVKMRFVSYFWHDFDRLLSFTPDRYSNSCLLTVDREIMYVYCRTASFRYPASRFTLSRGNLCVRSALASTRRTEHHRHATDRFYNSTSVEHF